MSKCIVITRFTKDQPGFLDFAYRIRALASRYALTVVSHYPLDCAELNVVGVEYIVLPSGESRMAWLHYLYKCARLIRTRKPEFAVLLHTMAAPISLLAGSTPVALYWNEHPTHFLSTPGNSSPKQFLLWILMKAVFRGAKKSTLTMPIGEAHREDLLAHGCDINRVQLIYMGVATSFSGVALRKADAGRQRDPIQLVYIGSVNKARGRDVMLGALALANRAGTIAHLTIVGASKEEQSLCYEYAKTLGIRGAVSVHCRVPGHQIPSFLSDADAGICIWEDRPWWRFNPPTKLFEYLVAGLPVLASNIRTHTQYISQWNNGMIFEYDEHSLAQAISELAECRSELPALSQRAYESGRQYLWDKIEPVFMDAIATLERT